MRANVHTQRWLEGPIRKRLVVLVCALSLLAAAPAAAAAPPPEPSFSLIAAVTQAETRHIQAAADLALARAALALAVGAL